MEHIESMRKTWIRKFRKRFSWMFLETLTTGHPLKCKFHSGFVFLIYRYVLRFKRVHIRMIGLPTWLSGHRSGRFPGGGSNPLQFSCLVNPMDRGAWRATVHRVAKSPTLLINEPTIRMLKLINTRVFYQREWGKDSFLRTTEQTLPGTLTLFMNKHLWFW